MTVLSARLLLASFFALAMLLSSPSWAANAQEGTGPIRSLRRIALVIGANHGGHERTMLRYARSDAETFAHVLRKLGGVSAGDIVRLDDPSPEELEETFTELAARTETYGEESTIQFLFYYSGHSNEQGLLLGEHTVDYRMLRTWVDEVPADVRIAILDSCASGAFTRRKGGVKTAPFLVGAMTDVKGHAFLTSSSENEAAQESDRIGGSFFTHYLTTGLRGAADKNGDRLITLNEAYKFAFDETLARTEATQGGPQHAAYEIQLSGTGDLVMTDLRRPTGRLKIASVITGRVAIRNDHGFLAAELYKPAGDAAMHLALEPGPYRVMVDDGEHRWVARVVIPSSGHISLDSAHLILVPHEQTVERGDETPALRPLHHIRVDTSLFPPVSINTRSRQPRVLNNFAIAVFWNWSTAVQGVSVSLGGSYIQESLRGAQLGMLTNFNRGLSRGMQLSTGFNYTKTLRGAQLGLMNRAGILARGAQVGFINSAGVSSGVQLGVLNVGGRGSSVQIGLFNVAKQADAQLGLFSVTREGNVHPEIWTADTGLLHVGLRFPARYTYSLLAGGVSPLPGTNRAWLVGFGFGGHIPLPHNFFVDIDVITWAVSDGLRSSKNWGSLNQLRVLPGWTPRPRISIFAGPTFNVMVDRLTGTDEPAVEGDPVEDRATPRPGLKWVNFDSDARRNRVRLWVGFVVGLRF